ncbi:MAG: EAL domain-containing protein [Terracidiphilus sp.]
MALAVVPWGNMGLNLPENSDSAQQQEVLDALPALIFLERAGRIVYANAEARKLLGTADVEWSQRPVEDVLWGLFPSIAEPLSTHPADQRSMLFHATIPAHNGRFYPVEGTYSVLNPELREAIVVAHPGGRERAPRSRLMEDVLSSIPEAVAIVHGDHVLYTNAPFTRLFGYAADEATGCNLGQLIVPETRRHEDAQLKKTVDQNGSAAMETVRTNKDGELVDVSMQASPLVVNGERAGYVFTFRDIGERKQVEARLQHDALHDNLTGLPNRALFLDRVSLALTRKARRRDQSCGVLFLDLDGFKEINDALGHAAGDALLVAVSERLCSVLRPQDTAARLGGDEFAVLVENIVSAADLDIVAQRILAEMARQFDIYGHAVQATISMGIALAGQDCTSPDMLLRDADFAMYRAKQDGGAHVEVYDRRLEVQVSAQQERERELRSVLDKREFEIWYQPIYRLDSGRLEGFESLLRWRRSDGTIDSFGDLLSVAEDTGLSISLGRETQESVCELASRWAQILPQSALTLTINVTNRQFYHPDLIGQVQRTLASTGADPTRLLFEVAESTLNEHPDAAVAILQRLVDTNVRLAVDNFGSALAPLNHLVRMPIDVIKLDPKLTAASTLAGRQVAMLESLIRLGRSLGMQVVAQGIETPEQLEALARLGCELGQGHLLSWAVDPARAERVAAAGFWGAAHL